MTASVPAVEHDMPRPPLRPRVRALPSPAHPDGAPAPGHGGVARLPLTEDAHRAGIPGSPDAAPMRTAYPARDLHRRTEVVVRLMLEVVAGRRPVHQLHGMATRRVLRYLAAEVDHPARVVRSRHAPARSAGGHRHGLRSMRLCQPSQGAAEVSAVWRDGPRFRALAARFELVDQPPGGGAPHWRCTALRLG